MRATFSVFATLIPLFMVLVAGCDVTDPRSGAIRVTVTTSGADVDPDGYSLHVDAQPAQALGINTSIIIPGIPTGSRTLQLRGLAVNCLPTRASARSIDVVADDTVTAEFTVSCASLVGVVNLSVSSSGFDLDPDGYTVQMDEGEIQTVGATSNLRFENVREGVHSIRLGGVAGNCNVLALNPMPVVVTYASVIAVTIPVRCNWAPGTLRVTVSTTGDSLDVDGYQVYALLEYGAPRTGRVDATGAVALDDMEVGSYNVRLADVAGNCLIDGPNPRHASVATRATTDVSFAVTCTRFGNIRVRSATTGSDPDTSGYQVVISKADFQRTDPITSNGNVTVSGLFPAEYTLTLSRVTVNCEAGNANTRTTTVTPGATVDVVFDVSCAPVTQLVYWADGGARADLYTVNSNGSAITRLTTSVRDNYEPSWSPDGTRIAFRSNRDGNGEIYVMSASGSGPVQRLTTYPGEDYDPAWSPDGTKIAFVSHRDGFGDIYVMNADGSNVVRLTNHAAYDAEPAWSPDGTKIAFRSDRIGNPEVYVMNADGSGATRLTFNSGFDGQPAWSPDGTKIAIARALWCDDYYYYCPNNIYVMNADGSGLTRLEADSDDSQPAWSPDGRWIAFAAQRCDYYECFEGLWAARPTGGGANRTEIVSGRVGNPAWRR